MSEGSRRERIERILKDSEPVLGQPNTNEKNGGSGDIAGQGNQVVVGNDNIVITDSRHHITSTKPLRRSIRLLCMGLIILCVPLIFCVERTRQPAPGIIGSITSSTAENEPVLQTADLTDTTAPLTLTQPRPGFHCYAGCSFFRPKKTVNPLASQKPRDI